MRRTDETVRRAIGYARVSTSQQADSGLGMEAQCAAIVEAAARLKLDLVEIKRDAGYSGDLPPDKRPGLIAAMRECKRGDTLIVSKRDRLSRDPYLTIFIERELERAGARVASAAGEGTDDDCPTSILFRRILDAFAEHERLMISLRTAMALGAKRERGEQTGGVLQYGYKVVGKTPKIRKDGSIGETIHIAPCPVEQEWIGEMRRLWEEGHGTRYIARWLGNQGCKTRKGGRWLHHLVDRILRRPIVPMEAPIERDDEPDPEDPQRDPFLSIDDSLPRCEDAVRPMRTVRAELNRELRGD